MQNTALAACSITPPGIAISGGAPDDAEAAPGFAQALEQASTQARDAVGDDDAGTGAHSGANATLDAAAPASPRTQPGGLRPAGVARGHGMHKATHAEAPIEAAVGSPARLLTAAQDDASAAVADSGTSDASDADDAAEVPHDEAAAADLAAWVASLPLSPPAAPPTPSRALGAPSAPRADPASVVGQAASATAHAVQVLGDVAARKQSRTDAHGSGTPGIDTPAPGAASRHAEADTARTLPAVAATAPRGAGATTDADADANANADVGVDVRNHVGPQASVTARETLPATPRPLAEDGITVPAQPGHLQGTLPRPSAPDLPLQAQLHAAVGSKEFAPALGAQLSVLVRNGIEHAQLRLNPAEMGPIEVRISIDGSQAQVDFSAAHAHTRQALQDAVPALAGALRESGLTLTGGGVFEQPRDARGDAPAHDGRPAHAASQRADDEALPASIAPRPPRARGVLDLYA